MSTLYRRGEQDWLIHNWGARCLNSAMIYHDVCGVRMPVRKGTQSAWDAMSAVAHKHRYEVYANQSGAFNCRQVQPPRKPSLWSTHSWGTAVDLNSVLNPYGSHVYEMSDEFIADVLQIRVVENNEPVFLWGGHWRTPDPMHFDIRVTPFELLSGLINVPTFTWEDHLVQSLPTLRKTASSQTSSALRAYNRIMQGLLVANNAAPENTIKADGSLDGSFWTGTETAVRAFQKVSGLLESGVVDRPTWEALLTPIT